MMRHSSIPRRPILLSSMLLATGVLAGSAAASQLFEQGFKHSTSEHQGVAVGDLDGDGSPDYVATSFHGSNIVVRLNDGTGTVGPETSYPVGAGSKGVRLGDMDGDGDLDAVVACYGSEEVSVLLNDGTGTFGLATPYPAFLPHTIALGDLDADGDLDVAVADDGSASVTLLFNDGAGALTPELGPFLGSGETAGDLALGDLDADGDLDLAVTRRGAGDVLVALNEGGVLATDETYDAQGDLLAAAIADIDGDGDLDLSVGGVNAGPGSTVTNFRNSGDGSFAAGEELSFGTTLLHGIADLQLVDVDADGDPDLAMASTFGVNVTLNDGSGFFFPTSTYSTQRLIVSAGAQLWSHHTRPLRLEPADMDRDGTVDLVVANAGNWLAAPEPPENFFGYVSVLKNDGDGGYGTATTHAVGDGSSTAGAAFATMADLGGDGANDIITANPATNDVTVVHSWSMQDPILHPSFPVGDEPVRLAIGDLDGDRIDDLVVVNRSSADLSFLRGLPFGEFEDQVRFDTFFLPADVALGDLDGDGDTDVAVGHDAGASVSVLLNDGTGNLAPYTLVDTGTPYTNAIALSDVDGDGALDLVVASHGAYWNGEPGTVSVLRNTGNASFALATAAAVGLNTVGVAVADFNGDGAPDIATLAEGNAEVQVLMNIGGTAFGPPVVVPAQPDARHVGRHLLAADVDADGAADLVTANGDFSVSILLNENGTFVRDEYLPTQTGGQVYGTVWEASSVAIGDVDGDARPDIAVTDDTAAFVTVSRNLTDAEPICPTDLDGDGATGFNDLTLMLGNWGLCPGGTPTCPPDIDGDGSVGFTDLTTLLGNWGPCGS